MNDDFTTGYQDYRFTPAEFISWDIPDVNKPGRIITEPARESPRLKPWDESAAYLLANMCYCCDPNLL